MGLNAYVGSFTQPTTNGAQSVTGVGFQPKLILFFMADVTGFVLSAFHSYGAADGSHQFYLAISIQNAASPSSFGVRRHSAAKCIGSVDVGSASVAVEAGFTSMDSDGFTINWTTTDATQRTVTFIALGGTDVSNVFIGNVLLNSSTGSQAITGVGFQPDLVLFSTLGDATAPPDVARNTARANFGIGRPSTQQNSGCGANNAITIGTASGASYQRTSTALGWNGGTTVTGEFSLTSLDSDGFTLNITTASAAYMFYVAVKGALNMKQGSFNQPASTGNQSVTGVGFRPALVLLCSNNFAASTSIQTASAKFSQGASDGTNAFAKWCGYHNSSPTHGGSYLDTSLVIKMADETSNSTLADATFTSLDADGFSVNWTTADSTARQVLYLAFGPSTPADTVTETLQYQLS